MTALEERQAAYAKLAEVVQTLSDLDDAEDEDLTPNMPTAWVLIVGYETFHDPDKEPDGFGGVGGMVALYPKDGFQPSWKTVGIIHKAMSRMDA